MRILILPSSKPLILILNFRILINNNSPDPRGAKVPTGHKYIKVPDHRLGMHQNLILLKLAWHIAWGSMENFFERAHSRNQSNRQIQISEALMKTWYRHSELLVTYSESWPEGSSLHQIGEFHNRKKLTDMLYRALQPSMFYWCYGRSAGRATLALRIQKILDGNLLLLPSSFFLLSSFLGSISRVCTIDSPCIDR